MRQLNILWLDDDSPENVEPVKGVSVFTAQSCDQAAEILKSSKVKLDWVVVDLIVPQGSWGKPYLRVPGLHFIKYVNHDYKEPINTIAYSIIMTPEMRKDAIEQGAKLAYAKTAKSWTELVGALQQESISQDKVQLGGV